MRKILLLCILIVNVLLGDETDEWKKLDYFIDYNSSDYNIREDINYFELREFLFKRGKQLSKNYIPKYIIAKKPLSSYSRKIISQFQNVPLTDYIDEYPCEKSYLHLSPYNYRVNGYFLKKDKVVWAFTEKKDLIWVFDEIDTEAELRVFLDFYDSFRLHGEYYYKKIEDGYLVKKIEQETYPQTDEKVKKSYVIKATYLLKINKNGTFTNKLLKREREYMGHILPPPTPRREDLERINNESAETILDNGQFVTPMKEFFLF